MILSLPENLLTDPTALYGCNVHVHFISVKINLGSFTCEQPKQAAPDGRASVLVSVTYATEESCSLRHTSSTSTDFGIIAAYRTTNESQNFPTNQLTNLAAMSTVVSPLSRLRWRQTIIQRDTHELLGKSRL